MTKASEIFEGENSSLKKTFDEAVKERTIDEIVEELRRKYESDSMQWEECVLEIPLTVITQTLQAERQRREEVVEATEKQTVLTFSKNILEIYNRDPQGALYILEQNAYEALTQPPTPLTNDKE